MVKEINAANNYTRDVPRLAASGPRLDLYEEGQHKRKYDHNREYQEDELCGRCASRDFLGGLCAGHCGEYLSTWLDWDCAPVVSFRARLP